MSLKLEGRAGRSLLTAAPWLFFVVLILLWELVCQGFSLPAYVLPAPSAIVEAFFNVEMTRWFTHLW
ncbi:MAG TPA: ABC transporter permease, partial [Marinobacter adhaerens]|nr:ABC transporter permease [Marinobacter adhaerens]